MHPGSLRRLPLLAASLARPRRVAWAHSTSECYVYLKPRGTSLEGSVQVPIELAARTVGFDASASVDALQAHRDGIVAFVSEAVELGEHGAALQLEYGELRLVETGAGRFCAVGYSAPDGTLPRTVTLSIDGLLEIDHHVAVVGVVSINKGWGRFGRRIRDQHRLDHHHTSRDIVLAEPSLVDHVATTAQGILRRGKNRVSSASRP